MFAGILAIVAVLSLLPITRLVVEALAPAGTPSLAAFARVFADASTWTATRHTIEIALGGTVLALLLGGAMALVVALTDVRYKGALVFCFVLPLMIPPQVTAIAWLQVFGPSSPMLQLLDLAPPIGTRNPLYSRDGIILLLGMHYAPLVFLTLRAGLRMLPRDLVEAGLATGARPLRVVATIVVPLMIPPLIASAMLTAVSCVGNFGIPALLGIPGNYTVLTTLIYQRLAGLGPRVLAEVSVLSILIGLIALLGVVLQGWLLKRADYRLSGMVAASASFALGGWRLPAELTAWATVVVVFVLPMLAMALTSIVPAYGVKLTLGIATLENYAYVALEHAATRRAFVNSFLAAGGAAMLLMALCMPLGYFLIWRDSALLRFLNLAAELPYALPGVVLAIACILIFLKPLPVIGLGLYNTIWIIFVAYLMRFLTLELRPILSAFQQLDRAFEEAARMSGAGFLFRLWTISLPLVAPAATAGALIVFLTAFNELTVSALLWSSGAETLGVVVFSLEQGGESTSAAALAMLTVVVTVALMAAASGPARWLPRGVVPWRD
ncbi:MAG: ABC transporter permease [Pseudomonadota bacterium]